jgi:hypothetical protein
MCFARFYRQTGKIDVAADLDHQLEQLAWHGAG